MPAFLTVLTVALAAVNAMWVDPYRHTSGNQAPTMPSQVMYPPIRTHQVAPIGNHVAMGVPAGNAHHVAMGVPAGYPQVDPRANSVQAVPRQPPVLSRYSPDRSHLAAPSQSSSQSNPSTPRQQPPNQSRGSPDLSPRSQPRAVHTAAPPVNTMHRGSPRSPRSTSGCGSCMCPTGVYIDGTACAGCGEAACAAGECVGAVCCCCCELLGALAG